MVSKEEGISGFVDRFSWQDGFRSLVDKGLTNREVAEQLNLSRGGKIKMSSAVATARRWRNAITGSARQQRGGKAGPKDTAVVGTLKRQAAADRLRQGVAASWKGKVVSDSPKRRQGTGTRSNDG